MEQRELAGWIKQKHPEYNGWTFEYMYPGYFSYYKGYVRVFFTPDFNDKGQIDQQVQTEDGDVINDQRLEHFNGVKYSEPLTVEQLFDNAKPMMDAVDKIVALEPDFGKRR